MLNETALPYLGDANCLTQALKSIACCDNTVNSTTRQKARNSRSINRPFHFNDTSKEGFDKSPQGGFFLGGQSRYQISIGTSSYIRYNCSLIRNQTVRPLDVFLTQPEQRLMAAVLMAPERDFGTVELLSQMGSSRSAGSAVLKRWVESGALTERKVGNQRRLAANQGFILYPELRKMVLKTVGLTEPLTRSLAPVADQLREAFVFGSVASGKDTSKSDIDLVVVGNVDLFTVSPLLDAAEQELGRPIHVNVYGDDEWSLSEDTVLRAIKAGPRIDLMGGLRDKTR